MGLSRFTLAVAVALVSNAVRGEEAVPESIQKESPVPKDLSNTQSGLQTPGQAVPDSILNAKPPADSPPQILKEILVTPPVQNDNPAAQPLSKPVPMHIPLESVLNAKPPAESPPQILKEILVTPENLVKGMVQEKPLVNTPIENLNAHSADASQDLKEPIQSPVPVSPPVVQNDAPSNPPVLNPHSLADRAALVLPSEPDFSDELRRKLEDSLVKIKKTIDEASPALVAAASGGAGKVKSETSETESEHEHKTEKPAQTSDKQTYSQIIGHLVEQLLEIPQVFIQSVREAIQGLIGSKISLQVTHTQTQFNPLAEAKEVNSTRLQKTM